MVGRGRGGRGVVFATVRDVFFIAGRRWFLRRLVAVDIYDLLSVVGCDEVDSAGAATDGAAGGGGDVVTGLTTSDGLSCACQVVPPSVLSILVGVICPSGSPSV